MKFYTCTVESLQRESKHCMSVNLVAEQGYPLQWLAGQHLVVKMSIEGQTVQRCFSISEPCHGKLRLTVKDNGKQGVSAYFNHQLKVGDRLQISEPRGEFYIQPCDSRRKSYYFFAAGSGITPIYSMLTSLLQHEPDSVLYCLYGNREHKHIIFYQALEQLQQQYPQNLVVCHALSSASWLSSFSPWRHSRIDQTAVADFIQQNPPYAQDCEYYICGPDRFIQDIKSFLAAIDVPQQLMFSESFGGQADKPQGGHSRALLTVEMEQQYQLQLAAGQTLLEGMLQQGINAPFSCQAGVCGACACKLNQGKVLMHSHMALDEQQLNNNIILACQAVADSETLSISYD